MRDRVFDRSHSKSQSKEKKAEVSPANKNLQPTPVWKASTRAVAQDLTGSEPRTRNVRQTSEDKQRYERLITQGHFNKILEKRQHTLINIIYDNDGNEQPGLDSLRNSLNFGNSKFNSTNDFDDIPTSVNHKRA